MTIQAGRTPSLQRVNAYRQDAKGSFKVAYTPRGSDQYVFSYLNQQAEKGNPPYAGTDPAVRVRYWQWPQWDKEGFYFSANKGLGEKSYLRARLYYDKFDNFLRSFDDTTYTTQTRPFAFNSPFDDDTYGTILELGTGALPLQTLKGSFYFKDDTHREGNIGEPQRSFRDQSFSWGFDDTVRVSERASAIVGFGADYLTVRNAQDLQNGQVVPFPANSVWPFNPQAAFFYAVSDSGRFRASFARKTRLPTIKDRYSYRMGNAIPNPDLARELSNNYEIGYSHLLGATTTVEVALFPSDITDSVQAVFFQPNILQLQNVGQAIHQGAGFSLRSQLTPNIHLTANYTYLSRENESAPSIIPVDTPHHKNLRLAELEAARPAAGSGGSVLRSRPLRQQPCWNGVPGAAVRGRKLAGERGSGERRGATGRRHEPVRPELLPHRGLPGTWSSRLREPALSLHIRS